MVPKSYQKQETLRIHVLFSLEKNKKLLKYICHAINNLAGFCKSH